MRPSSFLVSPYKWLKAISDFRATITGAPNFAYDLCVRKITQEQRNSLDLSCVRVALNGAEPIRADTLHSFARAFAGCGFRSDAWLPAYGLAEATLMVSGHLQKGASSESAVRGVTLSKEALAQNAVVLTTNREDASLVSSGAVLAETKSLSFIPTRTSRAAPMRSVKFGCKALASHWGIGSGRSKVRKRSTQRCPLRTVGPTSEPVIWAFSTRASYMYAAA